MKAADGRFGIGKLRGDGPIRRNQFANWNRAALSEAIYFFIRQLARPSPGQNFFAVQFHESVCAGILPGTDPLAMQLAEMGAAAEEAADIARKGADVISAADDQFHPALAREIVAHPTGLVQIDARSRQIECFAAMGLDVGAFAVDSLVAGWRGNLVAPADQLRQYVFELLGSESARIACGDDAAMRIAVIGFDAPADGGVIGFGNRVQIIEQSRCRLDEHQ
jgi:hypothetical protein